MMPHICLPFVKSRDEDSTGPNIKASAALANLNREDFVIQVFEPPTKPSLEACHSFVN
jgi:hypothetical protein